MAPSDWIDLFGTLAATFIGAWLGYKLASKQENDRDARLYDSLRQALLAEIERCGELANTYLREGILAPAYRFPTATHDVAFPQLIASGRLAPDAVRALIDFRLQAQQVNWCLDEIHQYVAAEFNRASRERDRLVAKLAEMKAPDSRFYSPAIKALKG